MPRPKGGRETAKPRGRRESRARAALAYVWYGLRRLMPSRPFDALAAAVALVAVSAVLVNALVLQHERHPAPLFAEPAAELPRDKLAELLESSSVASIPEPVPSPVASAGQKPVPAPRPEASAVRPKPGIVLEIQRALAERGYYDGELDGIAGPRTQQAIRDFEQAHGIKPSGEANDALLARVLRARARGEVTGSVPQPSTQVLAVQRVLARLGYGPISLSGLPDDATRNAIERFERDRGLRRTGKIGDRLIEELAAVTGAPVE